MLPHAHWLAGQKETMASTQTYGYLRLSANNKLSYWGPNTVLRKLNFLTGKIKYDGALYYNESEAHGVSQYSCIHVGLMQSFLDLSDAKLFMGNKVPTLNIIGQNDDFGPMMWDVSVTTKGSARHHCEGLLRSTNGVNYDDLDLSGECLQYFKEIKVSASEYVNVRVLHLSTGLDLKGHLKGEANNLKLKLSKPLPIPRGFPLLIGHKSQKPTLRQYDSFNGAFYTGAFGCPWMAILREYGPDGRACPVLLIDAQSSIGKSDSKHRSTKFALMTKTCERK
uniref:Uncharacterized protein n=1 Tax=Romanomermis culicivorax TaxID=13658 RepID=A0A915KIE5_ROMCU